jgi:hypothetical protein
MKKLFSILLVLFTVLFLISCGRFKDNGDGTVKDRETGLTWEQDNGGMMDFMDAHEYCEGLMIGDLSDWRLPTYRELSTLIDRRTNTPPRIDLNYFPKTKGVFYMTSSITQRQAFIYRRETDADPEEEVVMLVNFGHDHYYPTQVTAYVRCVSGEMQQK